jgi:DNA-binding CsgD family transcriptional regulator
LEFTLGHVNRPVNVRPSRLTRFLGEGQRQMFSTHEASDPIHVLEALYALEQPRETWFRGVLKAAASAFDRGAGVGFLLYDVSGDAPRIDAIDGVNVETLNVRVGLDTHYDPEFATEILNSYRRDVCATMAEHVHDPRQLRALRDRYKQTGVRDQLLVNGASLSGFGCALYVFSKTSLCLSPTERELMTRIAAHLSSAYRLKRRLEQATNPREKFVEAVLKVDGQLEHAETTASTSESLQSLTDAVKRREWARGASGRNDPNKAMAAWKPMVGARWSLADRYEHNGTRYIAARENAPSQGGPEALSPRERQVSSLAELGHSNKLIAYELGLAHSTVRVLLARAAAKMGVRTRSEVVDQFRKLV